MVTNTKASTPQLTNGGWARVVLYVLTVLVALVAVLAPIIGFGEYTDVAQALAAILAVLSGGTATLNVPKAEDQNINLREVGPAVLDLVREVQELRQKAATPEEVANELEARHLALDYAEPVPVVPSEDKPFSVYHNTIKD